MTLTKHRPTFRIIENSSHEIDYDEFKKDFLNPHMSVNDLRNKHNLSRGEYREYRSRVCEETGLLQKPVYYIRYDGSDFKKLTDTSYLEEKENGWVIVKTIDYKSVYYGRYKDLDTARRVRNKLIESDWDNVTASELKEKYAEKLPRPAHDKAVELFEEYEDLYLNSNYTIAEIMKMLDLSNRCYSYLTKMMREKHGNIHRWRTHD